MHLNFIKPEKGEQPDPDLRELRFLKNQYGRRDDTILLRYQNGPFLPPPGPSFLSRGAKEASADDAAACTPAAGLLYDPLGAAVAHLHVIARTDPREGQHDGGRLAQRPRSCGDWSGCRSGASR